ncbi:hypothetical protein K437DRAFT_239250 [Tilletiaria anomala UBC 951]|uniref:Uncharacterized protein n=1 Tax=Tilletiaria anomala (strain ATCC 24038 / CBS 436.72 / UBC 951) TaxID=1037660 RepID=A0A066VDQ7_TILAU|nr:uncharacterized protein K437DRAFT_239250 [Tilletiaria anomala UBC 951]KDN39842.1 hypothetical protein K437DRAFT_239250 [Tilletiaria anomala UBC 951]
MASHNQDKAPSVEEETFVERSAFSTGMSAAGLSAGAGLIISAVQNSLGKHNAGAMGIFTRYGSTIATFTAMGGAFAFTDAAVANVRQKNDPYNGAAGGCAAGLVAGAQARSLPMMFGACAGMAALVGTFDAAGRSMVGLPSVSSYASGKASEGEHGQVPGGLSWREEKEKRRQAFFKKRPDAETEE